MLPATLLAMILESTPPFVATPPYTVLCLLLALLRRSLTMFRKRNAALLAIEHFTCIATGIFIINHPKYCGDRSANKSVGSLPL